MVNLNFKPEGGWYVTDPLDGGDKGVVAFQLKYEGKNSKVYVETCVDKTLGWNVVDAKKAVENHCDIINGVLDGLNVRIRTDYKPVQAKVTTL